MIQRDINKIPKPLSNPAVGHIADTLEHYGISQAKAAKAMNVTPQLLNNVIRGRKGVSTELAMRFAICFNTSAALLIRLQSDYDFQVAYHAKQAIFKEEVEQIA